MAGRLPYLTIFFAVLLRISTALGPSTCVAQVPSMQWKDPVDGDYHDGTNWKTDGQPANRFPNSADSIFLGNDWVYSIYVNRPATAESLDVTDGDLTLHLAGGLTTKSMHQGPSKLTLSGGTLSTGQFTSTFDSSLKLASSELAITGPFETPVESIDVGPEGTIRAQHASLRGRLASYNDPRRSQIAFHDSSTLDTTHTGGSSVNLDGMIDLLVDDHSSVRTGAAGVLSTANDCKAGPGCETFLRFSDHSLLEAGRIWLGTQGTTRMVVEDSDIATLLEPQFNSFELGTISLNATGTASMELRGATNVSGFSFISVRPGSSLRLEEKLELPFNTRPRIDAGVALEQNSLLSGSGDILGQVVNSGIVDAGALSVSNYLELSDGTLRVLIAGKSPSQYSRIVTQSAHLAGRLEVSFGVGYRPEVGDSYNIISGEQLSGAFSSVRGFDRDLRAIPLSGGKMLVPIYSATEGVTLSVEARCGALCQFKKGFGPVLAEALHDAEKADVAWDLLRAAAAFESGGGSAAAGAIISHAIPKLWAGALVGKILTDPPDPDFRTLAIPSGYLPEWSALDGVPISLRTALIEQCEDARSVGYDVAALCRTTEKLSGAIQGDDVEWEMSQDDHFEDLLVLMRDDLVALVHSTELLAGEFEKIPGLDSLIAEDLLRSIQGLSTSALIDPNSLNAFATSLDAGQAWADAVRSVSLEEVQVSPIRELIASEVNTWRTLLAILQTGVNGGLPGDTNRDGSVSLDDFAVLKDHFGQSGGWSEGDFDGDGQVGLSDFGVIKSNFGKTSGQTVPEPATWLLASLAAFGCLAMRNRAVPAPPAQDADRGQ